MSPDVNDLLLGLHSFPRVSGDEPTSSGAAGSQGKFSPRERG